MEMIRIIRITNNKNFFVLSLSNNAELCVFKEVIDDLNLRVDSYIDINYVREYNEYCKCLKYSFYLLKNRDYSYKKLSEKLRNKFKKNIVVSVINYLKSHNYINEDLIMKNLIIKHLDKNDGPNKIKQSLKRKGFDVKNFDFSKLNYNLENCINNYLNKHKNEDKIKIKQKLYRYLLNKGYNINEILQYERSFSKND